MSNSVWPHRQQPTRLPHPGDSPGKNTGVGCHFLLHCIKVKSESEVGQSCPTLSDPMDCSPSGSSVHGICRQEYWRGVPLPSPQDAMALFNSSKLVFNPYGWYSQVSFLLWVIRIISLIFSPYPFFPTLFLEILVVSCWVFWIFHPCFLPLSCLFRLSYSDVVAFVV